MRLSARWRWGGHPSSRDGRDATNGGRVGRVHVVQGQATNDLAAAVQQVVTSASIQRCHNSHQGGIRPAEWHDDGDCHMLFADAVSALAQEELTKVIQRLVTQ